ncbi:MAG: ATP synthase F0 subunit C [Deltaproteobacteria bacterium]|nr:ATP synthase F0 subunit C [Deltaproteobacteria bacterium]
MNRYLTKAFSMLALLAAVAPQMAFAAEGEVAHGGGIFAIGAGVAIGLAALGGTLGQGKAISSALDSIGRNPAAQGKLFIPMLIGLAFVESLVIIAFVIAFQLVGKA